MGNEYMQYPASVKALAKELIIVCDDYYSKKINNDRIKEVVLYYADSCPDKFFSGDSLNSTIVNRIGKKRVRLISEVLKSNNRRT